METPDDDELSVQRNNRYRQIYRTFLRKEADISCAFPGSSDPCTRGSGIGYPKPDTFKIRLKYPVRVTESSTRIHNYCYSMHERAHYCDQKIYADKFKIKFNRFYICCDTNIATVKTPPLTTFRMISIQVSLII